MAIGTLIYQNTSGYADRIDNPEDYRTYNVGVGKGLIDNKTNATLTLYSRTDAQGDSEYINPGTSTYLGKGYQSFRFAS